ncbi:hypothetical protein Q0601_04765 [Paracoccus onubensis]|uniref:hypothetical protein n=1 Tax=Paracoccus onubensis TaxID=1675788 RepID=UPI00273000A7|nr:hypothetical protein [Paracoccus onubensis]MDP0926478.1 hypothetical protein [Paracoccus onubensis]
MAKKYAGFELEAMTERQLRPASRTLRLCAANNSFDLQACISGVGVANLREFHAKADFEAGNLVELMPEKILKRLGFMQPSLVKIW